jgi:transposase
MPERLKPLKDKVIGNCYSISREELSKLYWEDKLTAKAISQKLGCSKKTVLRLMKRYNIPRRPRSEAHKGNNKGRIAPNRRVWISKEQLEDLYWRQNKSIQEIAEGLQCSREAIRRWMIRYNIPRRSDAEGARIFYKTHPNYTREKFFIAKDALIDLYYNQRLSCNQIAEKFGVSGKVIRERMEKFNLPRRSHKEACRKGQENPLSRFEVRNKIRLAKVGKPLPKYAKNRYIIISKLNHKEAVLAESKNLETQGFRCIPLIDVIPDIIAIKRGKVYAVEVETGKSPDYTKYEKIDYYDDVFWIIIRRERK